MKASDLLVAALEAEGVEYIFAVPGEDTELHIMNVERMRHHRGILDLPDFGGIDPHCLVDTLHVLSLIHI